MAPKKRHISSGRRIGAAKRVRAEILRGETTSATSDDPVDTAAVNASTTASSSVSAKAGPSTSAEGSLQPTESSTAAGKRDFDMFLLPQAPRHEPLRAEVHVSSWNPVMYKVRRRIVHLYVKSLEEKEQLITALQPYKAVRGKTSPFLAFFQAAYPHVRATSDLETLTDLDYDRLVKRLAEEVLGFQVSFSPQTGRQHAAVDSVSLYFGAIYTSGYDSAFSPAVVLEEEVSDSESAYFAAALGLSASRQFLSVPSAIRERLGLEDVRVSLAARKRSTDSFEPGPASASFQLIEMRQSCRDMGLNWEALAKVRANEDLKRRLQQSYPYRILTHGISLHQEAAVQKKAFSLKKWLGEQCSDPFRPAWLPACTHSSQGPMMQVDHSIYHFETMELFLEARSRLLQELKQWQDSEGPEWVLRKKQIILDKWFGAYYSEVELPLIDDWKEVEGRREIIRQATEQGQWTKGGSPQDQLQCIAPRIPVHAADALFARRELINGRCLAHYLYSVLGCIAPEPRVNHLGLQDYDNRRGKALTSEAATALKGCQNRLLFEPYGFAELTAIKSDLRSSIIEGRHLEVHQAQFDALVSSATYKTILANADTRPLQARVASMLGALSPSLDLVLQYRADGELSSHSDGECVFLVPSYLQRRQSSLVLTLGIMFIAILCKQDTSGEFSRLQLQLEGVLEAIYPLEYAYRKKSRHPLSLEHKQLATECHQLVSAQSLRSSLPHLLSLLSSSAQTIPRANIAAVSKTYAKSPSRLRRDSGAALDEESGDSDDDTDEDKDDDSKIFTTIRQVADGLRKGYEDAKALSACPEVKAQLIKSFDRVGKVIERKWNVTFTRTSDGLPLAFLPPFTTSQQAFELASLVWIRAIDECDADQEDAIAWTAGDWWRVLVVWLLHAAQYGARDPVTGLAFDFTGRPFHPLRPTLLAHRDHSRPFLEGTEAMELADLNENDIDVIASANATVQSWRLNRFVAGSNVASLLAIFEHSRTGSKALLERLVAGGLINACPEAIARIGQSCSLVLSTVQYLLHNGQNGSDVVDDVEASVD